MKREKAIKAATQTVLYEFALLLDSCYDGFYRAGFKTSAKAAERTANAMRKLAAELRSEVEE